MDMQSGVLATYSYNACMRHGTKCAIRGSDWMACALGGEGCSSVYPQHVYDHYMQGVTTFSVMGGSICQRVGLRVGTGGRGAKHVITA